MTEEYQSLKLRPDIRAEFEEARAAEERRWAREGRAIRHLSNTDFLRIVLHEWARRPAEDPAQGAART